MLQQPHDLQPEKKRCYKEHLKERCRDRKVMKRKRGGEVMIASLQESFIILSTLFWIEGISIGATWPASTVLGREEELQTLSTITNPYWNQSRVAKSSCQWPIWSDSGI